MTVAARPVEIVDTTTRDGNQSLWSATGLTARETLAIAPTLERVGFHALDFTSSTHMAVSVRFHREDPWEVIRLMRAATPGTLLSFITTGMRFIAWQPCDEDVMRLAFRCVVRNGIRRFQFAEPANDPEALRRCARIAREEGVEEIVVGLTYSISPVHTHAYYAERVAALADCADIGRFYLKDPGGLLTTDAVRELGPHFAATGRTVELHSHCTIGLAPLSYMEGLRAGFDVLHTALGPAGNGTSQPTAESTLRNLQTLPTREILGNRDVRDRSVQTARGTKRLFRRCIARYQPVARTEPRIRTVAKPLTGHAAQQPFPLGQFEREHLLGQRGISQVFFALHAAHILEVHGLTAPIAFETFHRPIGPPHAKFASVGGPRSG